MKAALCCGDRRFAMEAERILKENQIFREVLRIDGMDGIRRKLDCGNEFDYVILEGATAEAGLEFAEELYRRDPEIKVVFAAEDGNQLLEELFLREVNTVGFYWKPMVEERFLKVMAGILKRRLRRREEKFVFRKRGEVIAVPFDDIYYMESRGHRIYVYTGGERHSYYGKIGSIKDRVPERFLQCHKSYLVNMDKIKRMEKTKVILEKDFEVPVSQAQCKTAKERFEQYLKKTPEYVFGKTGGGISLD